MSRGAPGAHGHRVTRDLSFSMASVVLFTAFLLQVFRQLLGCFKTSRLQGSGGEVLRGGHFLLKSDQPSSLAALNQFGKQH